MEEQYRTSAGQGFGIAALVISIIAIILAIIPCIGTLAILPASVGLIFGIIGLIQASNGKGAKGMIIAAIIISTVSIVLSLSLQYYISKMVKDKDYQNIWRLFTPSKNDIKDVEIDTADSKLKNLEETMDKLHADTLKHQPKEKKE